MDKARCSQAGRVVKKGKKKQANGELDRVKQAEKKKRRLEKALANSAAIRSELEKKKQKKMEEQQRLDAEGAAIAEAVALQVLIGEDSDESCRVMEGNGKLYPLYCSSNSRLFGYESCTENSLGALTRPASAYGPAWKWNDTRMNQPLRPLWQLKDLQVPYYVDTTDEAVTTSDLIAAQAFSSLQIVEDTHVTQYASNCCG